MKYEIKSCQFFSFAHMVNEGYEIKNKKKIFYKMTSAVRQIKLTLINKNNNIKQQQNILFKKKTFFCLFVGPYIIETVVVLYKIFMN